MGAASLRCQFRVVEQRQSSFDLRRQTRRERVTILNRLQLSQPETVRSDMRSEYDHGFS